MQLHHIENFCHLKILNMIFDSDCCDWNVSTSTFDTHLFNREQIVILLEDTNGNTFGCFIQNKIVSRVSFINGEWIGNPISDQQAFLFELKTNGKLDRPYKFTCKQNTLNDSMFILYGPQEELLFSLGNGDLSICKQSRKNECFCQQNTYDYQEGKHPLFGNTKTEFEVKRIQVFQMYETDELRKEKEEVKKLSEKEKQLQFTQETELLETLVHGTIMEQVETIKMIEQWTQMGFHEIIFDSDVCSYSIGSSTFDKRIYGRGKLVFLIEDENNNIFGCFVNQPIDRYWYFKNNQWNGSKIVDKKTFIFTIESNGRCQQPMKFEIKPTDKSEAFALYHENESMLFSIGNGFDICIFKEESKHACYCCQQSFDYQGYQKVLVGNESKSYPFTLKRIQVFQMKEINKK